MNEKQMREMMRKSEAKVQEEKRPARECGPCSLCCKVMEIEPLQKPRGRWCPHAKKKAGCAIYAERPDVCGEFECLWIQGIGPDHVRPDKIHAVLTVATDKQSLVIHEDPGWSGYASVALRPFISHLLAKGTKVLIACGDSRRLLAGGDGIAGVTDATVTVTKSDPLAGEVVPADGLSHDD